MERYAIVGGGVEGPTAADAMRTRGPEGYMSFVPGPVTHEGV